MIEFVRAEMERVASISNRKDGDYVQNGILYCGECHEAKQAWVDWLPDADGNAQKKLVPVMCKCALEEEQREKDREEELRFREALQHYTLEIHGPQPVISKATFADDTAPGSPISKTCRRYVEQWDEMKRNNMGILFFGSRGTGKSFYASCIVNAMIERKVRAVMTTTANLMQILSATWDKSETLNAVNRVPLLALDDLGAERDTSYSAELMYNVINTRYNAKLPTIVTTNLDFGDMKAEEDIWRGRIYDRVIEMCPIAIPMTGESRRSGIADQRKALARELLRGEG